MKNKLSDLNNHLFAQLERLSDEDLLNDESKLKLELQRTKCIKSVSQEIISAGRLALNAQVELGGRMGGNKPEMLEVK
ncbi:hypothetical protein EXA18_06455 [Vibrio cincinnatiensis]|uniref:hypothetical protein n=1 Tax=Vibrio cincinnatiensis TaxID=675 RepID=UPI001EE097C1|nr:hypothetical protein [Vibrio cincinnatiensis]MCG3743130.1 hypothetical protein [Vibrio cincinnatiensis]